MTEPLKILMLEDSATDAELIQSCIQKHRPNSVFKVVMEKQAFTEALTTFKPHLLLSDNSMPQFSASEALELFKQAAIPIPFILVTGTISEDFAADMIKKGAADLILKDRLTRLPRAIDAALQKKELEHKKWLAEEQVRFQANLLRSVGQAVIATNLSGTVIYWNNAAEKIYGWQQEEVLWRNIFSVVPLKISDFDPAISLDQLKAGIHWNGELLVQAKGQQLLPVFVSISPYYDSQQRVDGFISVSYDITDQKRAEQNMRQMEKEISEQKIKEQKKISRAILKGQEEERNHIGRELHDNINQILAGAKIFLSLAAKKNQQVKELLVYPMELLTNSIEEIRMLTYRQVTALKNINLHEQLTQLVENTRRSGIQHITLGVSGDIDLLPDELKLNVYRLVQEQLNNILKHASASSIIIDIVITTSSISLTVTDDGIGFETSKKRQGIGITNMMNRVDAFDGNIEIRSAPGKGCVLLLQLPFEYK